MDKISSFLYIISAIFFIRGIKLLGKADTARKGNLYSAIGMLVAVVTVLFEPLALQTGSVNAGLAFIFTGIIIGAIIGAMWSRKVEMTAMPELVALFNGFGGLSSFLVAIAQYIALRYLSDDTFTKVNIGITIAIGAIAFTGSIVAWGRLSGKYFTDAKPLENKNTLNMCLGLVGILGIILYSVTDHHSILAFMGICIISTIYLVLGYTMVISIGGGDMPVVISLLNAFSGIAASFAGFAINNIVLVVSGCLVGASGLILTIIMCKAMNRTLLSLLFSEMAQSKSKDSGVHKEPKSMTIEDAYMVLESANSVVFVPGYGMAVAQAQHSVKELAARLEANGAEVNFAIHPVAGRMPGHMNVLLAEADIPYDQLRTSDEINPTLPNTDVVFIIGANDVVNPLALTDETSPIYGMPIINAFEARTVFVLKRGKGVGFSGIDNPLFTNDNTVMLYGDAKQTVAALVNEFEN